MKSVTYFFPTLIFVSICGQLALFHNIAQPSEHSSFSLFSSFKNNLSVIVGTGVCISAVATGCYFYYSYKKTHTAINTLPRQNLDTLPLDDDEDSEPLQCNRIMIMNILRSTTYSTLFTNTERQKRFSAIEKRLNNRNEQVIAQKAGRTLKINKNKQKPHQKITKNIQKNNMLIENLNKITDKSLHSQKIKKPSLKKEIREKRIKIYNRSLQRNNTNLNKKNCFNTCSFGEKISNNNQLQQNTSSSRKYGDYDGTLPIEKHIKQQELAAMNISDIKMNNNTSHNNYHSNNLLQSQTSDETIKNQEDIRNKRQEYFAKNLAINCSDLPVINNINATSNKKTDPSQQEELRKKRLARFDNNITDDEQESKKTDTSHTNFITKLNNYISILNQLLACDNYKFNDEDSTAILKKLNSFLKKIKSLHQSELKIINATGLSLEQINDEHPVTSQYTEVLIKTVQLVMNNLNNLDQNNKKSFLKLFIDSSAFYPKQKDCYMKPAYHIHYAINVLNYNNTSKTS